jgi:hypothetical protein
MAAVMEQAAETDEKRAFSEQELISKLTTENKVSMKCWLLKKASALACTISRSLSSRVHVAKLCKCLV